MSAALAGGRSRVGRWNFAGRRGTIHPIHYAKETRAQPTFLRTKKSRKHVHKGLERIYEGWEGGWEGGWRGSSLQLFGEMEQMFLTFPRTHAPAYPNLKSFAILRRESPKFCKSVAQISKVFQISGPNLTTDACSTRFPSIDWPAGVWVFQAKWVMSNSNV